jgi:hypothetical protein
MSLDISNLPDDINTKITSYLLYSNSSDVTMKKLASVSKTLNKDVNMMLMIFENTNVKKFTKFHYIENILPIVQQSIFSFDQLGSILIYIKDENFNKKELKKKLPLPKKDISTTCLNNTFIVYQVIKHSVVLYHENDYDKNKIIDEILFDLFDNIYNLKTTSKDLIIVNHDITNYDSSKLDGTWHTIGFNIYYIFEMYKIFQTNKNINISHFKSLSKYILSDIEEVNLRSIKFIAEQAISQEDNHYLLIFSYMLFYFAKTVDREKIIKILFRDENDTFSRRISVKELIKEYTIGKLIYDEDNIEKIFQNFKKEFGII